MRVDKLTTKNFPVEMGIELNNVDVLLDGRIYVSSKTVFTIPKGYDVTYRADWRESDNNRGGGREKFPPDDSDWYRGLVYKDDRTYRPYIHPLGDDTEVRRAEAEAKADWESCVQSYLNIP